jgi:hypothetical protein
VVVGYLSRLDGYHEGDDFWERPVIDERAERWGRGGVVVFRRGGLVECSDEVVWVDSKKLGVLTDRIEVVDDKVCCDGNELRILRDRM